MVKAKTKPLNLLIPEELSEWFTDYAKSINKTKTEIICTFLQGIKNGDAYSDIENHVGNDVDSIESVVRAYLDKHLQDYVEKYLHSTKKSDVANPVDSNKDSYVEDHVDTDVVIDVVSDSLPVIEAIATDEAPIGEPQSRQNLTELSESAKANVLDNVKIQSILDETLTEAIAATDKPNSTRRSGKSKEGLNTKRAYEIACQRGFTTTSKDPVKAFRESFDSSNARPDLGLTRIPHKAGVEKWLYFDTKTQS